MPTSELRAALVLVEAWPTEMQNELAAMARDIDAGLRGGVYHASPEELAGIDRGLADIRAGRIVPVEEIDALFDKYRPE